MQPAVSLKCSTTPKLTTTSKRSTRRSVGPVARSPKRSNFAVVPPLNAVNARYFLAYGRVRAAAVPSLKVLDFGCGRGEIVQALREEGLDVYGAETFYGGANFAGVMESDIGRAGYLRAIDDDGRLPFENDTFDLVISNQVFEHVEDLETVASEIHRVLEPGGTSYHHFPSREVLREGHIGIPLAHRFRPGRFRSLYPLALRRFGLGTHKGEQESPREWTARGLVYIDNYTCYRPYEQIRRTLAPHFDIYHREIEYCRFRAGIGDCCARSSGCACSRIPASASFAGWRSWPSSCEYALRGQR